MDKFWKEYGVLIIAVVVIYALYKMYKFTEAVTEGVTDLFGAPENAETGGSENLPVDTNNLTYNESWYVQQADVIEQSVWAGSGLWEDDEAMEAVLVMLNTDDDFIALSNAYGVRGRGVVLRDYYNLIQTVQEYLDDSNKEAVNQNYAAKGMNTRV